MSKGVCVLISFVICILCAVPECLADEIDHSVDFPKGDAAWSVVFKVNGPAVGTQVPGAASSKMFKNRTRTDIIRQGDIRRDTISFSDGSSTQLWWSENPPVAVSEDTPNGHVTGMRAFYMAPFRFDASSFEWVSEKTFLGMKALNGKACQYYEMEVTDDSGGELSKRLLKAWIDHQTLKPVALDDGYSFVFFLFSDGPPSQPLNVPPNVRRKLKQYQDFYAAPKRSGG